jgi:hypothetical protein
VTRVKVHNQNTSKPDDNIGQKNKKEGQIGTSSAEKWRTSMPKRPTGERFGWSWMRSAQHAGRDTLAAAAIAANIDGHRASDAHRRRQRQPRPQMRRQRFLFYQIWLKNDPERTCMADFCR